MPGRSGRDEKQAETPATGTSPPTTPSPKDPTNPTRDITVGHAVDNIKGRQSQIDKAIEDAGG